MRAQYNQPVFAGTLGFYVIRKGTTYTIWHSQQDNRIKLHSQQWLMPQAAVLELPALTTVILPVGAPTAHIHKSGGHNVPLADYKERMQTTVQLYQVLTVHQIDLVLNTLEPDFIPKAHRWVRHFSNLLSVYKFCKKSMLMDRSHGVLPSVARYPLGYCKKGSLQYSGGYCDNRAVVVLFGLRLYYFPSAQAFCAQKVCVLRKYVGSIVSYGDVPAPSWYPSGYSREPFLWFPDGYRATDCKTPCEPSLSDSDGCAAVPDGHQMIRDQFVAELSYKSLEQAIRDFVIATKKFHKTKLFKR